MKLDIGCGNNKKRGYIGIDKYPGKQVDIVFDLETLKNKGIFLPFADNSIDEICCSHTLEHLDCPIEVINEFHRILKSFGWLILIVPHARSWSAFADPTHKRYFVPETFLNYFKSDNLKKIRKTSDSYNYIKPWHIEKLEFTPGKLFDIKKEIYVKMRPLKEVNDEN